MTKPTKTAEELRALISGAADPKLEYLNVRIHGRPDGSWGMVLSGSSLPPDMVDIANRKARELAQEFDLAN